jgi:hypothetical protein
VAIFLAAASFISPHRPRSVPQNLQWAIESSVGLSGNSTTSALWHARHSIVATASKISILQESPWWLPRQDHRRVVADRGAVSGLIFGPDGKLLGRSISLTLLGDDR